MKRTQGIASLERIQTATGKLMWLPTIDFADDVDDAHDEQTN